MGLILLRRQEPPEPPPGDWEPADFAGLDSLFDPLVGVTTESFEGSLRVTQHIEQVSSRIYAPPGLAGTNDDPPHDGSLSPTLVTGVFGTRPAIRHTIDEASAYPDPSGRDAQFVVSAEGDRIMPSGMYVVAVVKYTATKTTRNHSQNTPLTLCGVSSANKYNGVGFSAGRIAYRQFVSGWTTAQDASDTGLNDGNPHLVAWLHMTDGTLRMYADGVLITSMVDDSMSPVTTVAYNTTWNGYTGYGTGYRTDFNPYSADDGYQGDWGILLVGVPSTVSAFEDDLAEMMTYSVANFGVAAP